MSGVGGLSSSGVVVGSVVGEGWWSVVDEPDGSVRVLAGPFVHRVDADLDVGAGERAGQEMVRPVYGVRRADGGLKRRPSPEDWAWLAHLGGQLDRLPDDWDLELTEDDPLVTLIVEVAAALAEAGLPLHESTGAESALGGACLTPEPAIGGIVVTWRQHDRMSVHQVHGAGADAAVQQVMNRALADVLALRGFAVDAVAGGSGSVVRPAG